jgi:hypothetical protein
MCFLYVGSPVIGMRQALWHLLVRGSFITPHAEIGLEQIALHHSTVQAQEDEPRSLRSAFYKEQMS